MDPKKPLTKAALAALLDELRGSVLEILGTPWAVEVLDIPDEVMGRCLYSRQVIQIDEACVDPLSVLYHECKHATDYLLGLDHLLSNPKETRVMCEETALRCLVRSNAIFKKL